MKGYWVAHVDVYDMDAYQAYRDANAAAFKKYGGRFLARGGSQQVVEGALRARTVVIEFDSYQQALDCYYSAEYAAAIELRKGISEGDVIFVEGYDGPQPADS